MSFIGVLSNGFISEGCPMGFSIGGLFNGFQKEKKIFCFENRFFLYMANAYVRESGRTQDMGHGM